jgi:hypothetical protein
MFNPFKKSSPPPQRPKARAAPRDTGKPAASSASPFPLPLREPALPEVQEGNDVTDWALWEDSVLVMDSQMQGLTPSARIYEREKERPSEYQDIDPFSSVHKKSK